MFDRCKAKSIDACAISTIISKHSITAQKSGTKCCNDGDVGTILILETDTLNVLNVKKRVGAFGKY